MVDTLINVCQIRAFSLKERFGTITTHTKHSLIKSSILSKVILVIRDIKLSQSTWIQPLFSLWEKQILLPVKAPTVLNMDILIKW